MLFSAYIHYVAQTHCGKTTSTTGDLFIHHIIIVEIRHRPVPKTLGSRSEPTSACSLTSLQALVCALQGNLPKFFHLNFSPTLFLTMAPSTPPLDDWHYKKGFEIATKHKEAIRQLHWFGPLFMEDGNSAHGHKSISNCCAQYRSRHGIILLPYPSTSPDMNPIEKCWRWIKQALHRRPH